MPRFNFTKMSLEDWIDTRNTIQLFSQVIKDFKSKFCPHQKNWEEHGLRFYAKGLTTGPIPVMADNRLNSVDLNLNFYEHKLKIFCDEMRLSVPLIDQSTFSFTEEVITIINGLGINCTCNYDKYSDKTSLHYDEEKAVKFWNNLFQIYFVFQKFRSDIMEETSDINFWPHHFDTSMIWFSGNVIEGKDFSNWSASREQMNFGFSTGDEIVNDPYLYITSYPFNEKLLHNSLPGNAVWIDNDWKGAVLNYKDLVNAEEPDQIILEFFNTVLNKNKTIIGI